MVMVPYCDCRLLLEPDCTNGDVLEATTPPPTTTTATAATTSAARSSNETGIFPTATKT